MDEIEKRFTYHPPKGNQPVKYKEIRAQGMAMAEYIVLACPDCREKSLAITKIEEAVMWANAAIARNG